MSSTIFRGVIETAFQNFVCLRGFATLGELVDVSVSAAEWKRLQSAARPSLKELLLSNAACTEFLVPPRGSAHRRQVAALR
jgi:hypothetical protein